jgi:hypothetical protein
MQSLGEAMTDKARFKGSAMAHDSLTSEHLKQAIAQTGDLRESMTTAAISQQLQAMASQRATQSSQPANAQPTSSDTKKDS